MKALMLPLLALAVLAVSPTYAADKKPAAAKPQPVNIDTNKDGKISLSEAEALATDQFALYDADKDSKMSLAEYRKPLDMVAKMKKFNAAKKAEEEKVIKSSFTRMDNDSDGSISKDEFLSDAKLRHQTMDLDKDGFVTGKEVEQLQQKIVDAHKKAVAEKKK